MLKADIIEPSTSAYNAPVRLVRTKNKTTRFCVDFRTLNSVWIQSQWETLKTFSPVRQGCLFFKNRLLRQGYRYHKLRKAFSKFYRRHFDIVSKYNVGLKTLLLQGLSELEFYGDLVYKFRKIIGKNEFPYHFKKIIVRYKKIGYNKNVMRQTACLVVNPIKVNSFAYLFNCTTVGRTSD